MKEKVNTHFSFPLRLDMTPYTEDFLMGKGERKEGTGKLYTRKNVRICFVCASRFPSRVFRRRFPRRRRVEGHWELRVRPHRRHGAHGHGGRRPLLQLHQGHRQPARLQEQQVVSAGDDDEEEELKDLGRSGFNGASSSSRRYLFNDAEVKPFDSAQLASECFGGEMTVRAAAQRKITHFAPTGSLLNFLLTLHFFFFSLSDENLRLRHGQVHGFLFWEGEDGFHPLFFSSHFLFFWGLIIFHV